MSEGISYVLGLLTLPAIVLGRLALEVASDRIANWAQRAHALTSDHRKRFNK